MSNAEILENLVRELKTLELESIKIQSEYQAYHTQVAEEVKKILVEAGVFEDINSLELQREEVRKQAEEAINKHRAKAQDLLKVKEYLTSQIMKSQKKSEADEEKVHSPATQEPEPPVEVVEEKLPEIVNPEAESPPPPPPPPPPRVRPVPPRFN